MATLPKNFGFSFNKVDCYKDASRDPWTFSFVPAEPKAELNIKGAPTISLLASQLGAILQLQARWDVDPDTREGLKAEVAKRHPSLEASLISVEVAPLSSPTVVLSIGDGQNDPQPIETANSSGFSPYSTLMNVRLTADEKAQAIAALEGQKNRLILSYQSTLAVSSSVETTLAGDLTAEIEALSPESSSSLFGNLWQRKEDSDSQDSSEPDSVSLSDCAAQIEAAIQADRLSLTQVEVGPFSKALRSKGLGAIKQMAAAQLLSSVNSATDSRIPDEYDLQVTDTQTDRQLYTVERHADLATWVEGNSDASYMQVSPTSIEEPTREPPLEPSTLPTETSSGCSDRDGNADSPSTSLPPNGAASIATDLTVRLGFGNKDIPVSSIQVTYNDVSDKLRRPKFEPITLSSKRSSPERTLLVETDYIRTGSNFIADPLVLDGNEWSLMPKTLGLVLIVVDASEPKAAGAQKLQLSFHYRPDGEGVRDRQTINFYERDDKWIQQWFVITKSNHLSGIIEWSWRETLKNGETVKHESVETTNPILKCSAETSV